VVSLTPLEAVLSDVWFCHWPLDRAAVVDAVPDWVTVDTADGDAWVTAMGYTVDSLRSLGRSLSGPTDVVAVQVPVLGPSDQRGAVPLAVLAASGTFADALSLFSFPVESASVTRTDRDGRRQVMVDVAGRNLLTVEYDSDTSGASAAPPDSLAGFLADRERYFLAGALGVPLVSSVGQQPWHLRGARGDCSEQVLSWLDLPATTDPPIVHASPGGTVALAPPVPVGLE
jgi:hypothetical protein